MLLFTFSWNSTESKFKKPSMYLCLPSIKEWGTRTLQMWIFIWRRLYSFYIWLDMIDSRLGSSDIRIRQRWAADWILPTCVSRFHYHSADGPRWGWQALLKPSQDNSAWDRGIHHNLIERSFYQKYNSGTKMTWCAHGGIIKKKSGSISTYDKWNFKP